jgi:VIT1/CCC1 family predicted Fe2+/Mn2+ transporter
MTSTADDDSMDGQSTDPLPPVVEHHHRDVQGGAARAAVFGVSDGLVSNVSLILGIAGAGSSAASVRLAGLAGLVAGSVSMAAGEYVSMKAQSELLERELEMERIELRRNPNVEIAELAQIYQSRGIDPDAALVMARSVMHDPKLALETHAREELGINPDSLGSPVAAAAASLGAFAVGALLPLLPWLFTSGSAATVGSVILGILGALAVGTALAGFTGRSRLFSAARQLAIAVLAASVTYLVGRAVGVGVS